MISALMSSCFIDGPKPFLPTGRSVAPSEASDRIASGTSWSCRMTSADWISRMARTVRSSGSPGPAPTKATCPRGGVWEGCAIWISPL